MALTFEEEQIQVSKFSMQPALSWFTNLSSAELLSPSVLLTLFFFFKGGGNQTRSATRVDYGGWSSWYRQDRHSSADHAHAVPQLH